MTRDVDLGVTPDGGPVEGAPVLEPLEHSVLEKSLDGEFTKGVLVLEPFRAFGSGRDPGRWTYGGGASSGIDRAFGSGKGPRRSTYGGYFSSGLAGAFRA